MSEEEGWELVVELYAIGRPGALAMRQKIIDYMYADSKRAARLLETVHGKFVSELATPCPDLILRSMYRNKIIEGVNKIIADIGKTLTPTAE